MVNVIPIEFLYLSIIAFCLAITLVTIERRR